MLSIVCWHQDTLCIQLQWGDINAALEMHANVDFKRSRQAASLYPSRQCAASSRDCTIASINLRRIHQLHVDHPVCSRFCLNDLRLQHEGWSVRLHRGILIRSDPILATILNCLQAYSACELGASPGPCVRQLSTVRVSCRTFDSHLLPISIIASR